MWDPEMAKDITEEVIFSSSVLQALKIFKMKVS